MTMIRRRTLDHAAKRVKDSGLSPATRDVLIEILVDALQEVGHIKEDAFRLKCGQSYVRVWDDQDNELPAVWKTL